MRSISSSACDTSEGWTSRMKSQSLRARRSNKRLAMKPGNPVMKSVSLSGIEHPEYNSHRLNSSKGQIHAPPSDVRATHCAGPGPLCCSDLFDRGTGENSMQRQGDAVAGERRLPVCAGRPGDERRARTLADVAKVDPTGKPKHAVSNVRRHDLAVSGVDHLQRPADDRGMERDRSRLRNVRQ